MCERNSIIFCPYQHRVPTLPALYILVWKSRAESVRKSRNIAMVIISNPAACILFLRQSHQIGICSCDYCKDIINHVKRSQYNSKWNWAIFFVGYSCTDVGRISLWFKPHKAPVNKGWSLRNYVNVFSLTSREVLRARSQPPIATFLPNILYYILQFWRWQWISLAIK